jgi:hypothetical protein
MQPIARHQSWPTLREAMTLASDGRVHAAKSLWCLLDQEFRRSVLLLVREVMFSDPATVSTTPEVAMESPWGPFTLSPVFLSDLKNRVLEMVQ